MNQNQNLIQSSTGELMGSSPPTLGTYCQHLQNCPSPASPHSPISQKARLIGVLSVLDSLAQGRKFGITVSGETQKSISPSRTHLRGQSQVVSCFPAWRPMLLLTWSSATHGLCSQVHFTSKMTAPAATIISASQPGGVKTGKEKNLSSPLTLLSMNLPHHCSCPTGKILIRQLRRAVSDGGKVLFLIARRPVEM